MKIVWFILLVVKAILTPGVKHYVVVFQNSNELRATGGFMGSYAVVETERLKVRDIRIQDIYVPDGQLVGHVDPPAPINQAFGQGWWKLRDSNWNPDFEVAATQMMWFFEQGGERVDGIIAINLSVVNSILGYLGEIKPTDYSEVITQKSFYNLAQRYAEEGFFPGSTQKRDFLSAVGGGVIRKIRNSGPIKIVGMGKIVWQELNKKQIFIWIKDQSLENRVQQLGWSGSLGRYKGDYLYIVESNLGANKANCCIKREVIQEMQGDREKVTINWRNENVFENPRPPVFWGGDYIDYVRMIIPENARIQSVEVAGRSLELVDKMKIDYGLQEEVYTVETKDKFKTVGFWAVVPAQETIRADLEYVLPKVKEIVVRRQPGIGDFSYKLMVDGKVIGEKKIDHDTVISLGRGSN